MTTAAETNMGPRDALDLGARPVLVSKRPATHRPAPAAAAAATTDAPAGGDLLPPSAQPELLARFGQLALGGMALPELVTIIARETAAQYGAVCAIGELYPERSYRILAGTDWFAPLVDSVQGYESDDAAQGQHTLRSAGAIVFTDLNEESRFRPARLLTEHGVRSGVSGPILFHGRPWGTFGLFSPQPGRFAAADAHFVDRVTQILSTVVDRRKTEAALDARIRQQAALARLGREALTRDLPELVAQASTTVARTLDADFCKILELDRDGRLLILRAGVGWQPGLVGTATVPADSHSQAGFALRSDRAVVVDDLATETRFEPAPLLLDHAVVSGMSVIIRGRTQPYGVLGVHSKHRRAFSEDDIDFLETVAALLGTAIERLRVQDELRRHRAHLEEEVADRTRRLAASNKELEAFSYSVSHDLRAPLRTITGYSTLLSAKHAETLGPDSLHLLTAIHKNAERLGHLIDDLLDLSRVQQVDLIDERVDLSAICTQVLTGLGASDPDRVVEAVVQPNLVAHGDARLLGMLLENLLGNAWKFTKRAEVGRITVARHGSSEGAVYSVKDNGAGFDMAFAGKLFHPFQRLHRTSEFEGTGVGLATVRRIIERHGGRVWAEGRPGEGATFYFTLGGTRN